MPRLPFDATISSGHLADAFQSARAYHALHGFYRWRTTIRGLRQRHAHTMPALRRAWRCSYRSARDAPRNYSTFVPFLYFSRAYLPSHASVAFTAHGPHTRTRRTPRTPVAALIRVVASVHLRRRLERRPPLRAGYRAARRDGGRTLQAKAARGLKLHPQHRAIIPSLGSRRTNWNNMVCRLLWHSHRFLIAVYEHVGAAAAFTLRRHLAFLPIRLTWRQHYWTLTGESW